MFFCYFSWHFRSSNPITEKRMARAIGIGNQDFEVIRENNFFYIDKTKFIRKWWESGDSVTLITRPRRFGKTLNMSMVEKFFSVKYAGKGDLFQGLDIWEKESGDYDYRKLQGIYPVLFISFAGIKEISYTGAKENICRVIEEQYNKHDYLLKGDFLNEKEKAFYQKVCAEMPDHVAAVSLRSLSDFLGRYYGKKTIILLDEYDTPMQEAYVNGYWPELVSFTRSLFNSTFKTNPYLERAIMTGITRISKESIFSDLNNLKVVTTTSQKYEDCFGFTENEVFAALQEYGLSDRKQQVKNWYDGFTFGNKTDIYNPWSIINFLDDKKAGTYWANTSSNGLVSKLIREGSKNIKESFEDLLHGKTICTEIDEQIIYSALDHDEQAVWSLLLASGYLKVKNHEKYASEFCEWKQDYVLELTNFEVKSMFRNMIRQWFGCVKTDYHDFIKALLLDDIKAMNHYMNRVSSEMFSSFDVGNRPSEKQPERFYHGFVLGLMVELADKYIITSNRESGFGRYDIMLEPRMTSRVQGSDSITSNAIIIEFKVQDDEEKALSDTVQDALKQIKTKNYQATLIAKGIPEDRIHKYGFAFCGKEVLIGTYIIMN